MPHKRSEAKKTGSTTLGGATTNIHCASVDETAHCSQEDENITGTMHSPAAGYFHPEKSHGGYIETLAGAG